MARKQRYRSAFHKTKTPSKHLVNAAIVYRIGTALIAAVFIFSVIRSFFVNSSFVAGATALGGALLWAAFESALPWNREKKDRRDRPW